MYCRAGYKALEHIGFHRVSFLLQGYAHRAKSVLSYVIGIYVIHHQVYGCVAPLSVKFVGLLLGSTMHTVMYGYAAASQGYTVKITALPVVVIVVVLVCIRRELVIPAAYKHRIVQEVFNAAVSLFFIEVHTDVLCGVDMAHLHRRLTQALTLQTVNHLCEAYLHRRMIDTVIDGIITYRLATHGVLYLMQWGFCKVKSLIALARSK